MTHKGRAAVLQLNRTAFQDIRIQSHKLTVTERCAQKIVGYLLPYSNTNLIHVKNGITIKLSGPAFPAMHAQGTLVKL